MNIRSTSKLGLLFAASFVALGAVSAPAFSESTEFRRGYEEGFRDAMNGERPRYGKYDRRGRVHIENARYGINGEVTCNATDAVQDIVDAQRRGRSNDNGRRNDLQRTYSIPVNDRLCGDPAPRRQKGLIVKYRCGDADVKRLRGVEGDTLKIRCE